ncbi:ubiquinol-cytochrome c reductase iron-sulfur subunit [Thermodesulfobacteriota bacterium]
MDSTTPERRSFIHYALLLLGGALMFMLARGALRFSFFFSDSNGQREVGAEDLEELVPGTPLHAGEARAWLLKRDKDTQLLALDDRCTHLGCKYRWKARAKRYECPCHGSEFALEGAVMRGPATRPLNRLHVKKTSDGKLVLEEK